MFARCCPLFSLGISDFWAWSASCRDSLPSVFAGSGLTVGIAAELALFLLFLIISTIYVSFANGKFDPMLRHLVEKAGDGRAQ